MTAKQNMAGAQHLSSALSVHCTHHRLTVFALGLSQLLLSPSCCQKLKATVPDAE